MKKILAILAVLAMTISPVAASAQDHHRHGGNTTQAAILGAVGGLAVGVVGSALIHSGNRSNYNRGYQDGATTYAQPYASTTVTPIYPQPYPQQSYQNGYSDPYAQQAYVQPQPRLLPPPNGVRCLMWNGHRYAPIGC